MLENGASAATVGLELGSVENVLATIRDRIHDRILVPGQRLIEADLAAELRTNRSRLRQAFRHLAAEGLIRIDPNKGASVRTISRQELIHSLEVMEAVSQLMVAKAIDQHTEPQARGALERALQEARTFRAALASTREPRQFMDENVRFWDVFDSLQANSVLSDLRRRLQTTLGRLSIDGLITTDKERWISLHEDLLMAIMSGDRRRARALTQRSVHDIREAILALPADAFAG